MNAQPMGFYPPSSLVRDAQRRGVEVRPPHVNRSEAKCSHRGRRRARRARLRPARSARRTPRRSPRGSRTRDLGDLARRAAVKQDALEALVAAGACDEWGPRRELSGGSASRRAARRSPAATASSRCRSSRRPRSPSCPSRRRGSGCSPTTSTPRSRSASIRCSSCGRICRPESRRARISPTRRTARRSRSPGMAIARQRPSTANGVVFMLLEDEHGQANLIIPPPVYEQLPGDRPRRAAAPRRAASSSARPQREPARRPDATLGPLARQAASEAEVTRALPRAPLRPPLASVEPVPARRCRRA